MKFLLPICFLVFSIQSTAQTEEVYDPAKANLKEQYDYLYKKSNNYQDFKVIKRVKINAFWNNVADSLVQLKNVISTNNAKIATQSNSISDLENQIESLNQTNLQLNEEKDGISFMGSNWDKGKYKMVMWSVIFGLLGLGIITFLRFKRSNSVTKKTKARLSEVESEFEVYKKSSISREQEIKRELQNYINKLADITGN